MKKTICNIIILWASIFIVFSCVSQAAASDVICPAWKIGDKWLVKSVYQSPLKKDSWSAPVYWEYRVTGCEKSGSEDCYIISVKDHDGSLNLTAKLTYRLERGEKSFAVPVLVKSEIKKKRRGKPITKTLTYDKKIPIRTEQTLIPFDMPVFPLRFPSSDDFTVIKHVSQTLRTSEMLRQEVRKVQGGIKELPEWSGKRELTEVKCISNNNALIFVQYWCEDFLWPLFGRNGNMQYWLVEK
ncbi:hypothetical protein [Desulfonema magnum]|nr:hypothetical protein [Desulfonema magnum]